MYFPASVREKEHGLLVVIDSYQLLHMNSYSRYNALLHLENSCVCVCVCVCVGSYTPNSIWCPTSSDFPVISFTIYG